jgi:hypothetical protein
MHEKKWGMEYAGGAISNLAAMEHEFLHNWFGRYVFPATGNDGWMDEAIVSWINKGFPRDPQPDLPDEVLLSSQAPYNRMTPKDAYIHGVGVLQELDGLAGEKGLKPVLVEYLSMAGGLVVTTKDFHKFLVLRIGEDANNIFCTHIYGLEEGCDASIELPSLNNK